MSTDAALFDRVSKTYCYYDRWTNVTAFDLETPASCIEARLHEDPVPAASNTWVVADETRVWIAAIEADVAAEPTKEDRERLLPWVRKVAAFVAAQPEGQFRIYYDYEDGYHDLLKEGYAAWHGFDCTEWA